MTQTTINFRNTFFQNGKKPMKEVSDDIIQYMLQIERIKKLIIQHLNNSIRKE